MIKHLASLLTILILLLFTSGCGNLADLAQNFLYPIENVNETATPDEPLAGYGQAVLTVPHPNGDLKIHLWYRANSKNPNAALVIHFHGNGENIGRLAKGGFLDATESLGANFVVFDYPGYGKSSGHPEQSTLMAASQATVNWAKKMFPNSPLVFWGWSLGSAVAFQAAAMNQDSVRALIADSSLSSVRELAKDKFGVLADQIPEELYKKNEWNSLAVAPTIAVPLLMRHGSNDSLIPEKFGELVSRAVNPKLIHFRVLAGKNHGDIFTEDQYWPELTSFVNSVK